MKRLNLEKKRKVMEGQIAAIRAQFEAEEAETKKFTEQEKIRQHVFARDREAMGRLRKAD